MLFTICDVRLPILSKDSVLNLLKLRVNSIQSIDEIFSVILSVLLSCGCTATSLDEEVIFSVLLSCGCTATSREEVCASLEEEVCASLDEEVCASLDPAPCKYNVAYNSVRNPIDLEGLLPMICMARNYFEMR